MENNVARVIKDTKISDTLSLTETNQGWWLYDYTRRMNLSMRAETAQHAFVETITYYQRRLTEVEQELSTLKTKVEAFIEEVHKCPDQED
jgi:hypothetical protein